MSIEFEIRSCHDPAEFEACVALQEAVWGEGFSERVGVSLLKVAQRLGGVVAGAFDEHGDLAAFVFGVTGIEGGRLVHWSDMLAVRPGLRDAGLGRKLKSFQRERLLERGITRCYWTFDPLESRNGRLNLGKLGAVVREYVVDMYGESDSPLHRGIGTDRFVALWLLDSERVRRRLEGDERLARPDPPLAFAVAAEAGLPVPGEEHAWKSHDRFAVPIPSDIQAVKAASPRVAARWRSATRAVLVPALAGGFEVTDLVYDGGAVSRYVLERRSP